MASEAPQEPVLGDRLRLGPNRCGRQAAADVALVQLVEPGERRLPVARPQWGVSPSVAGPVGLILSLALPGDVAGPDVRAVQDIPPFPVLAGQRLVLRFPLSNAGSDNCGGP